MATVRSQLPHAYELTADVSCTKYAIFSSDNIAQKYAIYFAAQTQEDRGLRNIEASRMMIRN